jgi:hypothetical protein
MVYTQEHLNEVREQMREQCAEFIQSFATDYVEKWVGVQGDKAKAEGWAILQAAAALRKSNF